MTLIKPVLAVDGADISTMYNPAIKIPTNANLGQIFSENVLNIVFILIGLVFFANLIMAGWDYMLSTGDPKKIAGASTRLLNSVIGLIIVVTAYLVVRIVLQVLGLKDLI